MRLPVTADGMEGWFQLDTGLDVTLVYGDLAIEQGWETHAGMFHLPDFSVGEIDIGPVWIHSRSELGRSGELSGSIGLDLLYGYLVLIDYPGRRLALLKQGEVPLWMWQRATWTPAEVRNKKYFLTVVLDGKSVSGLFFDTGTSAFDITVDFDMWRTLTGLSGPDDASIQWKVNSWGTRVTVIGASASGPLVVGSARIEEPRVFYIDEQRELFANWPFPATGLVGNAPFWDHVVILDLGIQPRFGLLQD